MNDPVDHVLAQREALDRGFSSGLMVSGLGHGALVGGALLVAFLAPQKPLFVVADGFAVVLPRGGGGTPNPAPAAPPQTQPAKPEEEAAPPQPEPPKIIKPPQEEPRKGLPEFDAKPTKVKETPKPVQRAAPVPPDHTTAARSTGAGGVGTSSQTPGLDFGGPPGLGVPGGAEGGDYYMAGVQRKVWTVWMQQVKNDFSQQVSVMFTIHADGSVTDVQVTRSSGVSLLDLAAQRAVQVAAPFSPLPKDYGTSQITVQANFKPTF